jgi:H+/Cl- antiporter ClcA
MNNANSVSTGSLLGLDYLRPDVFRPDLYEKEFVRDIHGPSDRRSRNPLIYTIGIIIISALIFISLVAWADVLRSWFDSQFVNSIIAAETTSTLYYAITVSVFCIALIILLLWIYYSFII